VPAGAGTQAVRVAGCFSAPGMAWSLIPLGRADPGMVWGCVPLGWWVAVWVVGWSLVENCTVDASIFVFCG